MAAKISLGQLIVSASDATELIMPPRYLGGFSWEDLTRDERTFCSRLVDLIRSGGSPDFVRAIQDFATQVIANPDGVDRVRGINPDQEWEVCSEVVFFRDFQHNFLGGHGGFSKKRTFDICLFGSRNVIVFEAKSYQGFTGKDLHHYHSDRANFLAATTTDVVALNPDQIVFIALISSRYTLTDPRTSVFDGQVAWNALSRHYAGDHLLQRADDIYQTRPLHRTRVGIACPHPPCPDNAAFPSPADLGVGILARYRMKLGEHLLSRHSLVPAMVPGIVAGIYPL